MKKGKELKLKLNNNFKTYYGTTDNKDLKSVYVGITTWATPLVDLDNYSRTVSQLRQSIKNVIYQNINSQLFKIDHHIIDIDIKDARMTFNKSSYLNIEITLFTKNSGSILSTIMKMDMSRFLTNITNVVEKSNNFRFKTSKINREPAI